MLFAAKKGFKGEELLETLRKEIVALYNEVRVKIIIFFLLEEELLEKFLDDFMNASKMCYVRCVCICVFYLLY